jgi:putative spermidine/putrescine transport system permease protein
MSGRRIDDVVRFLCRAMNVIVVLFLLTPIVVTAIMAFDARDYLGPLPPPGLSLRWFVTFFSDSYFLIGLSTSLKLALASVAISLCAGIATAYALDRTQFRGKDALVSFFLSPLVVPPVVIGFALLLFLSHIGVFDGFARLLCGHVIITVPYTIRATLAGISGINRSFTEAALILGANEKRAFWDITYTLPIALTSSMRANFDLTIAAASLMLMVMTLVLIAILEKFVGLNRAIGQGAFR